MSQFLNNHLYERLFRKVALSVHIALAEVKPLHRAYRRIDYIPIVQSN